MTVHRGRNSWSKPSSSEKRKCSVNARAKPKLLQTTKPRPAACSTTEFGGDTGVDLINVDNDPRGICWRTLYSSEIRRKSIGETGRGYRIVYRNVNADGDYYEKLEWNPVFKGQNANTYRYWNDDGSFYEYFPDRSDYYLDYADNERYISPKYGGFTRDGKDGPRMMKEPPFFKRLVDERGLNNVRSPGHIFEPPWARWKAKRNEAVLSRQRKSRR